MSLGTKTFSNLLLLQYSLFNGNTDTLEKLIPIIHEEVDTFVFQSTFQYHLLFCNANQ